VGRAKLTSLTSKERDRLMNDLIVKLKEERIQDDEAKQLRVLLEDKKKEAEKVGDYASATAVTFVLAGLGSYLSKEGGSLVYFDWTFHYELSKPVYCKSLTDDDNIKLIKEGDNLKGFYVKINNKTQSRAQKAGETKAKNLEKILTILSGMTLETRLIGAQGVPKKPGLIRVSKTLTLRYSIDGWIERIDVTDPNIRRLIDQDISPELDYLSKAVAHTYSGRYSDSIREAFRIIDEEKYSKSVTDYDKYKCIRNILSHKEGQRLHQKTMDDFKNYFNPINDALDFKQHDDKNDIVVLDLESTKTQKTLEQVAKDLISEVRSLLKL
jgi:hypothetical protein